MSALKLTVVFSYAHNALCEGCVAERKRERERGWRTRASFFSSPTSSQKYARMVAISRARSGKRENDECALSSRQEVVVNLRMS